MIEISEKREMNFANFVINLFFSLQPKSLGPFIFSPLNSAFALPVQPLAAEINL